MTGLEKAEVSGNLPGGIGYHAVVTPRVILVDVNGRACLAHDRWFDREQAKVMIAALQTYVGET